MVDVHFKISIKSFEHSTLQPAKEKIEEVCLFINSVELLPQSIQLSGVLLNVAKKKKTHSSVSLPSSKKKFTLLKSPHIDKKSREQFQLLTYKTKIETASYNRGRACLLLLLLKNSELRGVETKIAINYSTPFCP